ncbi:hypothetical protein VHUM_01263 [Vanrija humicola]|uniref:PSP1 C-terminal domain-containing protein n=1 Tax=Vanrija humicola TaxID=5417 RepID=A0A7D8V287_VANHU|nr:hypothetical protein VHUM_01263 [Vanrija humicola]
MAEAATPGSPGVGTGFSSTAVPEVAKNGTAPPVTNKTSTPPPPQQAAAGAGDNAHFRPSPVRSFTVGYPYLSTSKGRATSQPPSERLPSSSPASGRGSPGVNGGSEFGVIGGSRAGGRFSQGAQSALSPKLIADSSPWVQQPSTLVRALSSHVEERPMSRSSSPSPFPTFSPSSSPSTSPSASVPQLPNQESSSGYSPPIAPANVSRSRSQSLATGVRPDRNFIMPMSTFDNYGSSNTSEPPTWRKDGSNLSPFSTNMRPFLDREDSEPIAKPSAQAAANFRTPQDTTFGSRAWASPKTASALSNSVADALGPQQPSYSSVVGGFEEANGGRSGTSSRRHSMSVVGSSGRRGFGSAFNEPGSGMTSAAPRRGVGSLGFTDDELLPERFGNALNLQVDESRKADLEPSSLPVFGNPLIDGPRSAIARSNPPGEPFFGSSPADKDSPAAARARFGSYAEPRSKPTAAAPGYAPTSSSPDRLREDPRQTRPGAIGGPIRGSSGPQPAAGPIGGSVGFDRFGAAPRLGTGGPWLGPPGAPSVPTFGRPNVSGFGYFGGIGQPPPPGRPPFQNGAFGGLGPAFAAPYPANSSPSAAGFNSASYFSQQPQAPPAPPPPAPTSPSSFSSLSLADLGKGTPLASLPPTTPLYIVTFKAGRRDVFYCPDPTLLISNGDRVIVEADRGSDLGTVVYDQLTPIEVREWQERQATAALLSGASQHQPPGMAMAGVPAALPPTPGVSGHTRNGSLSVRPPAPGSLDFTGADLNTLLSGVGPSGSQMDMSGGGIGARGPLAKEVMPKRIFTKSSGGPEEQA